jgi:hypothetical protein
MADLAIFGMGVGRAADHPSNRRKSEGRRVARVADGTNDFAPQHARPITEAPSSRGILAAMLAEPPPLCSRRTLPAEALAVLAEGCGFLLLGVLAAPIALPIENVARRDALVPGLAR